MVSSFRILYTWILKHMCFTPSRMTYEHIVYMRSFYGEWADKPDTHRTDQ